jgi:hypothetical protein
MTSAAWVAWTGCPMSRFWDVGVRAKRECFCLSSRRDLLFLVGERMGREADFSASLCPVRDDKQKSGSFACGSG